MEANRCTNVPRRVSCPVSRTVRPSNSSEPKARISPVAQSIGPWVIAAARRCSCGITLGCTVKPCGEGGVRVRDLLQRLHGDRGAVLGGGLLRVRRHAAVVHVRAGSCVVPRTSCEDALQPLLEAAS